MQNNELTTQLAQINTVSGIEKLNTTLGSISGQINSNQSLQASALIGHGVMVPGKDILVGSKEGKVSTTPFGVELERAADSVTATISDASGKVVRTIEIGGLSAGVHAFTWDGTLEDGSNAPDGAYTVAINAKGGGEQLVANPLRFAMVNGVTRGADGAKLDLGLAGQRHAGRCAPDLITGSVCRVYSATAVLTYLFCFLETTHGFFSGSQRP
ncbi:Basal-body rod modification protein flgD [Serratia rubidaea]|uniref:Basal-body rod modification protein flgD n=1 Tax=Serratia rubidaea TaxID=61652 RepID=A0A4V6JHG4_SERRU|nr:Basal-body rod modification protein flgD [Serratia rubidaea]